MLLYRRTRHNVLGLLDDIRKSGCDRVQIVGEGDIAEICRLTCLEQGIKISTDGNLPRLVVEGMEVNLKLKEGE
jgi:hypothetical protein